MVLSLRPSLLTTRNSIWPSRSSMAAGFSGKGTTRFFGSGGASWTPEGESGLSCFARLGEPTWRGSFALRLTGESRRLARSSRRRTSGDEGVKGGGECKGASICQSGADAACLCPRTCCALGYMVQTVRQHHVRKCRLVDLPSSVAPAMVCVLQLLSVKARLLSPQRLTACSMHAGVGGAFGAERAQANQRASRQRPPKPLRRTAAASFTPNCSLNTHVEPTTRRLGGCCCVAIPARNRKEHAVHRRLHAAVPVYVAVLLELSWSSANTAQPSSWVPSSVLVCAHSLSPAPTSLTMR